MSRPMSLLVSLTAAGYDRIDLTRNAVGHFLAAGTLHDAPVSILVDTGAFGTLVDLGYATAHGLPRTPMGRNPEGASPEIYTLDTAALCLGDVALRPPAIRALDLSFINDALIRRGVAPVEAILGPDTLAAHDAVLDYPSSSLFLRP